MNSSDTKNAESPLVSLVIITYNSGDFIIETLESAKKQTYENLELIVSDDFSTDNTVKLVKKWQEKNKTRFKKTLLITSGRNTGISSNANRGLAASNGIWFKYVAGDDMLLPDCIKDCIEFVNSRSANIDCLFAQNKVFTNDPTYKINNEIFPNPEIHAFYRDSATSKEQYKMWLNIHKYWPVSTSTFFAKRELLNSIGGFDERYEFMEDLPLFLKILEKEVKIYFMPKVTVLYRIHNNSILRVNTQHYIINKFQISKNQFIQDYILKRVPWSLKIRLMHELLFDRLVIISGNKGKIAELINKIGIVLNPVRLDWFRRKFNFLGGTQKVPL